MPDITPDLVAQVASKLYNQIPGEQAGLPRNSTDSRCIAATLFERAQQETSAIPGGKVPSLGAHADGLVRQQTYIGSSERHSDLKGFVNSIQSFQQPNGWGGNGVTVDPFAALLQASLPKSSKLGGHPPFNVAAIRSDFPILHQQVAMRCANQVDVDVAGAGAAQGNNLAFLQHP